MSYFWRSHEKILILFLVPLTLISQEDALVEEVIVVGTKASLIAAIDKQRESDKIVSIVDSDALGDFPDTTAAEAIEDYLVSQ